MSDAANDDRPKMPVTVITGFLGSGKTTLLNHLLSSPDMADTAVVINEFGEISLDHLLVETSVENTLVLQSGCICCSIRGDLVDTLMDLQTKRKQNLVPPFSRIAIETTGIADPAPILRTIATDPLLAPHFTVKAVVTTVDAINSPNQLANFNEAVQQVALADIIILTKTDLAETADIEQTKRQLSRINPSASMLSVINGEIASRDLFDCAPVDLKAAPDRLERWLGLEQFDNHVGHNHSHHDDASTHSNGIQTFSVIVEKPITLSNLELWLGSLLSLRGQDLLRIKGILNVTNQSGPIVVHAVQHLLHPISRLQRWPTEDHRSKIVFITRNIPQDALRNSLYAHLSPNSGTQ